MPRKGGKSGEIITVSAKITRETYEQLLESVVMLWKWGNLPEPTLSCAMKLGIQLVIKIYEKRLREMSRRGKGGA